MKSGYQDEDEYEYESEVENNWGHGSSLLDDPVQQSG